MAGAKPEQGAPKPPVCEEATDFRLCDELDRCGDTRYTNDCVRMSRRLFPRKISWKHSAALEGSAQSSSGRFSLTNKSRLEVAPWVCGRMDEPPDGTPAGGRSELGERLIPMAGCGFTVGRPLRSSSPIASLWGARPSITSSPREWRTCFAGGRGGLRGRSNRRMPHPLRHSGLMPPELRRPSDTDAQSCAQLPPPQDLSPLVNL